MSTRVKICGITRERDVEAAVSAGADYIGLVFAAGPRTLTPTRAAALGLIARELGFTGGLVGVFADEPLEDLEAAAEACDLDVLQLHGQESPAYVEAARAVRPVWKALTVPDDWTRERLAAEAARYELAEAILLDGGRGGSGRRFRHEVAVDLAAARRVVVAGGLDPENVTAVVRTLRPFAVDVSSGVEEAPGVKNAARVRAFVTAAGGADESQWGTHA